MPSQSRVRAREWGQPGDARQEGVVYSHRAVRAGLLSREPQLSGLMTFCSQPCRTSLSRATLFGSCVLRRLHGGQFTESIEWRPVEPSWPIMCNALIEPAFSIARPQMAATIAIVASFAAMATALNTDKIQASAARTRGRCAALQTSLLLKRVLPLPTATHALAGSACHVHVIASFFCDAALHRRVRDGRQRLHAAAGPSNSRQWQPAGVHAVGLRGIWCVVVP
jgi:hypothetical protein